MMLDKVLLVMVVFLLPIEAVALSLDIVIRHGRDRLRIAKELTGKAQITFKTLADSTLYASAWTSRHPNHLLVLRNDRFLTLRTDRFSRPAQELIRYLRRKRLSLHDFVYQMLGLSVLPPASRRRRVRSADGSSSIVLPPLLQEHTRGMPRVVLKYLSRSLAHFGKRVISHIFPEPWGGDSVVESRGSLSLKNNGEYDTIHVALSTNLLAVRINLH